MLVMASAGRAVNSQNRHFRAEPAAHRLVSNNAFNAANDMTAFNGTTLSYDANGNPTNDGTNTYAWDARNHLTAIVGPQYCESSRTTPTVGARRRRSTVPLRSSSMTA